MNGNWSEVWQEGSTAETTTCNSDITSSVVPKMAAEQLSRADEGAESSKACVELAAELTRGSLPLAGGNVDKDFAYRTCSQAGTPIVFLCWNALSDRQSLAGRNLKFPQKFTMEASDARSHAIEDIE